MPKKLKLWVCEVNRLAVSFHLSAADIDPHGPKFMNIVTQDAAKFYDDRHPSLWLQFPDTLEAEFSLLGESGRR